MAKDELDLSDIFTDLTRRLESSDEGILVAEVVSDEAHHSKFDRWIATGLVVPAEYSTLTVNDELGFEVQASGPYPAPRPNSADVRKPWFRIFAPECIRTGIEPLVLSWTQANQTVLYPDPGFLMTYGLVPRILRDSGIIIWDEPSLPEFNIVRCNPVSKYKHGVAPRAYVSVDPRFLQDYSTLRNLAICRVYQEWRTTAIDAQLSSYLGDKEFVEIRESDRRIRINRLPGQPDEVNIAISGHQIIFGPGQLPILNRDSSLGDLDWPGLDRTVTNQNFLGFSPANVVFVDDAVLKRYEEGSGFSIHPSSGSVSFGGQWEAGFCQRIGRNTIQLEIKKLYEGCPAEVIRHYYQHAVDPPTSDLAELRQAPNIATRSKALVLTWIRVGEELAAIYSLRTGDRVSSVDLVGMSREEATQWGWWKLGHVEMICRHVPLSLSRGGLLARCKDLYGVLIDPLSVKILRPMLKQSGYEDSDLAKLGSLRLLNRQLQMEHAAYENGLCLPRDSNQVLKLLDREVIRCPRLIELNKLRILAAHPSSKTTSVRFETALRCFEVDPESTAAGFGTALDTIYDGLTDEMNTIADYLCRIYRQLADPLPE